MAKAEDVEIDYDLRKIENGTLTIRVKETNEWRLRKWMALKLFWIGAKVIGFRVEVIE